MSTLAPSTRRRLQLEKRPTILVVEDSEDVRETICCVLESEGWHVLQSVDGGHALNVAEAHGAPIAAVVSHIHLPGLSGTELFERIRERHPAIGVLLISGCSEAEGVRQSAAVPQSRFLGKPFTGRQLLSALEGLLGVEPA